MTSANEVSCGAGGDGGVGGGAGVVTVKVSKDDVPQPSVNVVFHDAQGAPLSHLQTDGDGQASAVVPPGGTVTVVSVSTAPLPQHLLW